MAKYNRQRFILTALCFIIIGVCLISVIGTPPLRTAKGAQLESATPSDTPEEPEDSPTPRATRTRRPTRTPSLTPTANEADYTATMRFTQNSIYQANRSNYATATVIAGEAGLILRPRRGTLNNADHKSIATYYADVHLKNAIVTARFYNSEQRLGYFGILFRDVGYNKQYRVGIDYSGYWHYLYGTTFHRGNRVNWFDRSVGGFNDLQLIIQDKTATLFMNGGFVARFDISRIQDFGDIAIYSGVYSDQKFVAQKTRFAGFTVWDLPTD